VGDKQKGSNFETNNDSLRFSSLTKDRAGTSIFGYSIPCSCFYVSILISRKSTSYIRIYEWDCIGTIELGECSSTFQVHVMVTGRAGLDFIHRTGTKAMVNGTLN
jgi:hypothetical protein